MVVYVVGTVIGVLFTQLASNQRFFNGKRLSKGFLRIFEILAILPFVLIAGLRVNVGTDYVSYETAYMEPELWSSHFNEGFMTFIYALRNISVNPRFFFFATSATIYGLYVHIALKESEEPAFSVLFFVISEDYFCSMNGISQFVAIAVTWLAVAALRKNKWIQAILWCLLASTMHRSALFFLALLLLYKLPLSIKKTALLVGVACVAGIVGRRYLVALLTEYSSYGDYFSSKYADSQLSVALPMLMIYVVIFIVAMLLTDQKALDTKPRCRIFMIAVLLCILVMTLSYFLTGNTYRLTYYFTGIIGLYFPSVLKEMKTNKNRYIVEAAVIVLFTIWTTMLITHNNQNALPYYSIYSL